jgi:hypothetical protein
MPDKPPNLSNPKYVCRTLLNASEVLFTNKSRSGCVHNLPSTGTCWVSGDLHDNPEHLQTIIKLASLDSPANHLVLQELIHSGDGSEAPDLSYQTLVKVAELVIAYPDQVHPILANHELSQALGRSITKGTGDLVSQFIQGVFGVFDNDTSKVLKAINAFIFSMPLAVRSETGLMCTHSLPDEEKMDLFDVDIINREITTSDIEGIFGSVSQVVWGREHTQKQVNELAACWEVKLFCVGHAYVHNGIELLFSNVLALNSDHANGVVLPVDLENILNAKQTKKLAVKLQRPVTQRNV